MKCEHDYKVLDVNIEETQASFYEDDSSGDIEVEGYAVFYCRKCTDIQKVVVE